MNITASPDCRLIELADLLAGEIRIALDAFEELEAVALEIGAHAEGRRAEAIMERSRPVLLEMLQRRPSTFAGFQALEMARLWERGEWPGMARE